MEDPDHKGHYKTFLNLVKDLKDGKITKIVPDSQFKLPWGRCDEENSKCIRVFRNQKDKARHLLQIHQATKSQAYPDGFLCNYKLDAAGTLCTHKEPTRYKLGKHKEEFKHKIVRRKKNGGEAEEEDLEDLPLLGEGEEEVQQIEAGVDQQQQDGRGGPAEQGGPAQQGGQQQQDGQQQKRAGPKKRGTRAKGKK